MKVYHFADHGRGAHGITQGLIGLGFKVYVNHQHVSLGKVVLNGTPAHVASGCDLVFAGTSSYRSVVNSLGVLNKTIFYEFRDKTVADPAMMGGLAYFKRSVSLGESRVPIIADVIPINYAALDEYYEGEGQERVYDIGCFFDPSNPKLGYRRSAILKALQTRNPPNSLVGHSTAHSMPARLAVTNPPHDNPFLDFIKLQHRTKIIFTAQPGPVDGDNRTWEALASGALVFMDRCYIPTPDLPEDGVHCCHYDAADPASVEAAIDRAMYYLAHSEERERIAAAGYEFVKNNHRAVNRVRWMLDKAGAGKPKSRPVVSFL